MLGSFVRSGWLLLLAACSIQGLDGSDKTCPCARGLVCDETLNRCVDPDDAGQDAGRDATADVAFDAHDDGSNDTGMDAFALDAPVFDASRDSTTPDAFDASSGCPLEALYCIDFDDLITRYDVEGDGIFDRRSGYMSPNAGYFEAAASDESFIEVDPVSLPSTFYARLWFRTETATPEFAPLAIGEFQLGTGSDGRVQLQTIDDGEMHVVYLGLAEGFMGVFDAVPPGTEWTCLRLSFSHDRLGLAIGDDPERTQAVTLDDGDEWESMAFGIIESPASLAAVSIDEILVGPSPIPCE